MTEDFVLNKDPKCLGEEELSSYAFMSTVRVQDVETKEYGVILGCNDDFPNATFQITFAQGTCPTCGQMRQGDRELLFSQFVVVGDV